GRPDGASAAAPRAGGAGSSAALAGGGGQSQLVQGNNGQADGKKGSGGGLPPLQAIADGPQGGPKGPATPPPADAPHRIAKPPAAPIANPDPLLADAKAKLDAGDYLGVRAVLNDAVCNDQFTGPAGDQARALMAEANNKLVFSARAFDGDPYVEVARVESGKGLTAIARQHAVPWEVVCTINGTSDRRIRMGQTLKVPFGPFHALVSKKAFRLDLFLGGLPGDPGALYVTSLHVGLGKDDSTPTGLWTVAAGGKMKNPAWTNPRSGEHFDGYDAKNPLGGYWIALKGEEGSALGKTSYGIHGTIEPTSIGTQASMGCIRLTVDDIKLVYEMLSEGKSKVLVRD
ncbi:MAG: hypothetical protein JWO31_2553, partial [Phycisphaerales bacterium]|nr:hypothetical protein [Phycisphaerales bacterium]